METWTWELTAPGQGNSQEEEGVTDSPLGDGTTPDRRLSVEEGEEAVEILRDGEDEEGGTDGRGEEETINLAENSLIIEENPPNLTQNQSLNQEQNQDGVTFFHPLERTPQAAAEAGVQTRKTAEKTVKQNQTQFRNQVDKIRVKHPKSKYANRFWSSVKIQLQKLEFTRLSSFQEIWRQTLEECDRVIHDLEGMETNSELYAKTNMPIMKNIVTLYFAIRKDPGGETDYIVHAEDRIQKIDKTVENHQIQLQEREDEERELLSYKDKYEEVKQELIAALNGHTNLQNDIGKLREDLDIVRQEKADELKTAYLKIQEQTRNLNNLHEDRNQIVEEAKALAKNYEKLQEENKRLSTLAVKQSATIKTLEDREKKVRKDIKALESRAKEVQAKEKEITDRELALSIALGDGDQSILRSCSSQPPPKTMSSATTIPTSTPQGEKPKQTRKEVVINSKPPSDPDSSDSDSDSHLDSRSGTNTREPSSASQASSLGLSDDERDYYLSLPKPYNVLPEKKAPKTGDLRKIIGDNSFQAGTQYRRWRDGFISDIHLLRISVRDKCVAITRCLEAHKKVKRRVAEMEFDRAGYKSLLQFLEREFGDHKTLRLEFLKEIEKLPLLKYNDYDELVDLEDLMETFQAKVKKAGKPEDLFHFHEIIIKKISDPLRSGLRKHIYKRGEDYSFATILEYFSQHIKLLAIDKPEKPSRNQKQKEQVKVVADESMPKVTEETPASKEDHVKMIAQQLAEQLKGQIGSAGGEPQKPKENNKGQNQKPRANKVEDSRPAAGVANGQERRKPPKPKCHVCSEEHWMNMCPIFGAMSPSQRSKYCEDNNVCQNCLRKGHKAEDCRMKFACFDCNGKHNRLLHGAHPSHAKMAEDYRKSKQDQLAQLGLADRGNYAYCNFSSDEALWPKEVDPDEDIISLRYATVILRNKDKKEIKVNALLDDGSSRTMISEAAVARLGLGNGYKKPLKMIGAKGIEVNDFDSRLVDFELVSLDRSHVEKICGATVEDPTGNLTPTNWNEYKKKWYHMKDLEFPIETPDDVELLIGSDYGYSMRGIREIHGRNSKEPMLRLTPLGWTATGPLVPCQLHRDERMKRNLDRACFARVYRLAQSEMIPKKEFKKIYHSPSPKSIQTSFHNTFCVAFAEESPKPKFNSSKPKIDEVPSAKVQEELYNLSHVFKVRPKPKPGSFSNEELTRLLLKSMEMESYPGDEDDENMRSIEDQEALKIMEQSRTKVGKQYQVSCLWRKGEPVLPNNFEMVKKRWENLERSKAFQNPKLREEFFKHIEEWVAKGYFKKCSPEECLDPDARHLATFAVVREDKTTTKIRPVLDGRAKHLGKCLNDAIYPGPKVINHLPVVLTRFRKRPIAFGGDVKEMFLQVLLAPGDGKYQRILFRRDPSHPFQHLEPRVHIFGNAGSPCVAIWTVKQHAKENQDQFPRAAEAILESSIVDDVLDSVATPEEAVKVIKDLKVMFDDMGMNIRKFISNSPEVLAALSPDELAANIDIEFDGIKTANQDYPVVKALGMLWLAEPDIFTFNLPEIQEGQWTKRDILSLQHRIYDPLGWTSPNTLMAKLFVQDLWVLGVDWDDILSEELQIAWLQWVAQLKDLVKIKIPRCLFPTEERWEIHVFVDASSVAYGAAIYATSGPPGLRDVRFLTAISRVVGKKGVTIPRLELCAAVEGIKLVKMMWNALGKLKTTYWSDSDNVLCWLRYQGRQRKMYVANRLAKIMEVSDAEDWFWVPTAENPADMASRGASLERMIEEKLWFEGPDWLKTEEFPEQHRDWELSDEAKKETKEDPVQVCRNFVIHQTKWPKKNEKSHRCNHIAWSFEKKKWVKVTDGVKMDMGKFDPQNHSHLETLVSWTTMWIHWAGASFQFKDRRQYADEPHPRQTRPEIRELAMQNLIRRSQRDCFEEEIILLTKGKPIPDKSSLQKLRPRIDGRGLLRASGRLRYVDHLAMDQREPVILSAAHQLTSLIISYYHRVELKHQGGVNHLLATLQEKHWIVGAKPLIRKILSECVKCQRLAGRHLDQEMAPLPDYRVPRQEAIYPFETTAMDCCGPFMIERKKKWVVIFTCAEYRAIHLELIGGMSTYHFMMAFDRFMGLRNTPIRVITDNGTNFQGAANELVTLLKKIECPRLEQQFPRIEWLFTTPHTPHAGGVFERMIKSAKEAMKKIASIHHKFNEEEFRTLLVEAAHLVNSRPVTYVSDDIRDPQPLTPNHFLRSEKSMPLQLGHDGSLRTQYTRMKNVVQAYKMQFVKELVPKLHEYPRRWRKERDNIKVGEIVVLIEENHVGAWPLGRIVKVYEGIDGLVRSVDVEIAIKLEGEEAERVRDESKARYNKNCGKNACQFVTKILCRDIRRIIRLPIRGREVESPKQPPSPTPTPEPKINNPEAENEVNNQGDNVLNNPRRTGHILTRSAAKHDVEYSNFIQNAENRDVIQFCKEDDREDGVEVIHQEEDLHLAPESMRKRCYTITKGGHNWPKSIRQDVPKESRKYKVLTPLLNPWYIVIFTLFMMIIGSNGHVRGQNQGQMQGQIQNQIQGQIKVQNQVQNHQIHRIDHLLRHPKTDFYLNFHLEWLKIGQMDQNQSQKDRFKLSLPNIRSFKNFHDAPLPPSKFNDDTRLFPVCLLLTRRIFRNQLKFQFPVKIQSSNNVTKSKFKSEPKSKLNRNQRSKSKSIRIQEQFKVILVPVSGKRKQSLVSWSSLAEYFGKEFSGNVVICGQVLNLLCNCFKLCRFKLSSARLSAASSSSTSTSPSTSGPSQSATSSATSTSSSNSPDFSSSIYLSKFSSKCLSSSSSICLSKTSSFRCQIRMSGRGKGHSKSKGSRSKSSSDSSDNEELIKLRQELRKVKEKLEEKERRERKEKERVERRHRTESRSPTRHSRSRSRPRSDERRSRSKERESKWIGTSSGTERSAKVSVKSRLGPPVWPKPPPSLPQSKKVNIVPAGYESDEEEQVKMFQGEPQKRRRSRNADPEAHECERKNFISGKERAPRRPPMVRTKDVQCHKDWNHLSEFEQRYLPTSRLSPTNEKVCSESNLRIPEGMRAMLTYARENLLIRHEQLRRDLPEHLETAQGRDWNPVNDDEVKGVSARLHQRFLRCRPAIQLDDKSQVPLHWVNSLEKWREIEEYWFWKSVDKFGLISLDLEGNERDVRGQRLDNGEVVGKSRFLIIGLPNPEVIIVDLHAVREFQNGIPQRIRDGLHERGCIIIGSEIYSDVGDSGLTWVDSQHLLHAAVNIVGSQLQDNRHNSNMFGLGAITEFLFGVNYKPGQINRPIDGRYHPDLYAPNGSKGGEFSKLLLARGPMYRWRIRWDTIGVILGYMYCDALAPLALVLRMASGLLGYDTEKNTIRKLLKPHFFKKFNRDRMYEIPFEGQKFQIPHHNPFKMPEHLDRPSTSASVSAPRSGDRSRKRRHESRERSSQEERRREEQRREESRRRQEMAQSHSSQSQGSLFSQSPKRSDRQEPMETESVAETEGASSVFSIRITDKDREDFEKGIPLSASPSDIIRKKKSSTKPKPTSTVEPEKSKYSMELETTPPHKKRRAETRSQTKPTVGPTKDHPSWFDTQESREHHRDFHLDEDKCRRCGQTRPPTGCPCPPKTCQYIACFYPQDHDTRFCPYLGARCKNCGIRGHFHRHCDRFAQRQWAYVYENQQAKGFWTCKPELNVGVSVFPMPAALQGKMLIEFTKEVVKYNVYYPDPHSPRVSYNNRFKFVQHALQRFCDTWVAYDKPQVDLVLLQLSQLKKKSDEHAARDFEMIQLWQSNHLQYIPSMWKKPKIWSPAMMHQWRKVFIHLMWTAGFPRPPNTSVQHLAHQINSAGLKGDRSKHIMLYIPRTLTECIPTTRFEAENLKAAQEKREPKFIQCMPICPNSNIALPQSEQPQDVLYDLPIPPIYEPFENIVVPDTIYLIMGKRIMAQQLAKATSDEERAKVLDIDNWSYDKFY